ncbi:MAG: hypothetical protein CMJ24_09890 [Phycisphaerae bacterium]|nr:hypothetical protein [Phycisphaerae bacterium]
MPKITLSRTVRMMISARKSGMRDGPNTYAGTPVCDGVGAYYEFHATFSGTPAEDTGFVFSIYDVDKAIRSEFTEPLSSALAEGRNAAEMLPELHTILSKSMGMPAETLKWTLGPHHHIQIDGNDMNHVTLIRHYTFSSSHRLFNKKFDDAKNRELFGKCSHPSGHGHNYRLDAHVRVAARSDDAPGIADIDRIVMEHVIDKFDHRNLNIDIEWFQESNPTLENITLTCHQILEPQIRKIDAELSHVEVWETDRTSCRYPATT